MSRAITFDVTRKCASFGLAPGDTIILEPGAEDPVVLYRPLSVPRSAIDALIESGALEFAAGQSYSAEDCHRFLDFLHPGVLRPFQDIVKGLKGVEPADLGIPGSAHLQLLR